MADRLTLEVSRDGWTKGLQLSINQRDEKGLGSGYRLAGPKFNGSGETLLTRTLTEEDAKEIRAYLDAVFPLPALFFELDRDSSVMYSCPDCEGLLWLDSEDAPTLGDVVKAASEHKCGEDGGDD